MKPLAIILIILVLAAFCAVGYLYFTAHLDVSFVSCIATDAVSQADYFNDLTAKLDASTFIGTRFSTGNLENAEHYQFLTYTVRLDNHAFLGADVIELHITPMQGDVLQVGDQVLHSLKSGQQMDLSAMILTSREMHSIREATVSYYFWGIPFTTKLTLGK